MVDIIARLKIRAEEFSRGSKAAFGDFEKEAAQAGERASAGFASKFSGGLLVTGAAVTAAFAIGNQALDQAKNLREQSKQLGVSTDALQEYRYAAEEVGVTQEELGDSLGSLMLKIGDAREGSKEVGAAFKALGIDVTSVSGSAKSTSDVMAELIGRVNSISDPIARAQAKSEIFGDGWRRIDPLLAAGSARVHELREAAHQFGVVISEDAIQHADETADKLSKFNQVLNAKVSTIVLENTDAIMGLASAMGWVADKANTLVKNLQGVERLKRDEGWAAGFFSGWDRQQVASDPVKYLQSRTSDLQQASGRVERLSASGDNSFAGQQALKLALSRQKDAQRLMEVARQEVRWMQVKPDYSGVTGERARTPETPKPGKPAKSSGSSAGSDADRDLQKQIEDEKRLRESLEETIQRQEDSARVSALRAEKGDLVADKEQALLSLARQYPQLEGATVEALMQKYAVTADQAKMDLERYEVAKKMAVTEIEAEAIRRQAAADNYARIETERKAQAELDRLREQSAERQRRAMEDLGRYYLDLFSGRTGDIWRDFKNEGLEVISLLAAQWTIAMMTGQKFDPVNAFGGTGGGLTGYAGPATTLFNSLFGRKNIADMAAREGGSAAEIVGATDLTKGLETMGGQLTGLNRYLAGVGAGQAVSGLAGAVGVKQSSAGAMVGSLIGTATPLGPLGGAIGGLVGGTLGGVLGGLLNPSRSAGATITGVDSVSVGGKDRKQYDVATGLSDSVIGGLQDIAEQLGGTVGSFRTTIGTRGGDYRVNADGSSLKIKNGAIDFNDDAQAAISYAIADAISDGAIQGLTAASQRILQAGATDDLAAAIEKATLIEAIPKALQARLDPVAYAIDTLNDKWDATWDALEEGAATAEQMAEAQKLYNMELEEVKNATASAAKGLKDFIAEMNFGSSSPLSLRDQEKAAYDALAPYLAQIDRGESINQDAYMTAAQSWLNIERQLYGSTAKYFEGFDKIQATTAAAIADIESVTSISTASDPFNQKTASATAETAANTSNIAMLLQSGNADLGTKLDRILAALTTTGFVGSIRNF